MSDPVSVRALAVAVLSVLLTGHGEAQSFDKMDERWTVMVNGQTVPVEADGSFVIPNVSAPDQFGPGGPGTAPDFASDDLLRVIGVAQIDGETRYAFSDLFRFRAGQEFSVGQMTLTETPPPFPQSIVASPLAAILTTPGEETVVRVLGTLIDGSELDVTGADAGTTYRTSNPAVCQVDQNGVARAEGTGTALITALNEGAASVTRILVALGDPLTQVTGIVQFEDGTPSGGASVSVAGQGLQGTTQADGTFSIPGAATLLGDIRVTASTTVGMMPLAGGSAEVTPIPGGLTDAGIITLLPGGPTVTIGMPPDSSGNCFPFGCSGTRYQQVYNAQLFPGPLSIQNVSFFLTQGPFGAIDTAQYTISLSTTGRMVNQLLTDFDQNLGSDNALFFSGVLGGAVSNGRFTIPGDPFFYDPAEGNLLVDIVKGSVTVAGGAFMDARNGSFGTDSSRVHNFGSQFASWGLVTEFNSGPDSIRVMAHPGEHGEVNSSSDGTPVR